MSTTIPDRMKTISKDTQHTFEELVKLLVRKTLPPILNPLGQNKVVYNTYKGKHERGFIGSTADDNINKYSYILTNESLGWADDILVNFKVLAKFIKNNNPQKLTTNSSKMRNSFLSKSNVSFSDKEIKTNINTGKVPSTQYKNFTSFISSRSITTIIANKKASYTYIVDIPYSHSFKQLESIGKDIIDQTDASIKCTDTSKMSTAMLRAKLYTLDKNLADLSVDYPELFNAYIEMLRIINSIPRPKMIWVINLISHLSFQSWTEIPAQKQKTYEDILGEEFIEAFNANEMITILLQSNSSEIILTSAYLYSLIKMLFIVFGYSKLVPLISNKTKDEIMANNNDKLKKHLEKYKGGTVRRNSTNSDTDISCSAESDNDVVPKNK